MTNNITIPTEALEMVNRLKQLAPNQKLNTGWIQNYRPNQGVNFHQDPGNTIGATVIGVLGDFTGGKINVEGTNDSVLPGDVYLLRCKVFDRNNLFLPTKLHMPWHSVEKICEGQRTVLMLSELN